MNKEIKKLEERKLELETKIKNIDSDINDAYKKAINKKITAINISPLKMKGYIEKLAATVKGCPEKVFLECILHIKCKSEKHGENDFLIWHEEKPIIILDVVNEKVNGVLKYISRGGAPLQPPE